MMRRFFKVRSVRRPSSLSYEDMAQGLQDMVLRLTHNDPALSELRLSYNFVGDEGCTAGNTLKHLGVHAICDGLSRL
jgi:hypothetical protein